MRTKSANKKPTPESLLAKTNANKGVAFEFRAGRPKPFVARWTERGVRKSKTFASEKDRADYAAALLARRERLGKDAVTMSAAETETWQIFRRMIGAADPLRVAQFWLQKNGIAESNGMMTVQTAVERYLGFRYAEGVEKDSDTGRHFRKHLSERFCASFGPRNLAEINADELRDWLAALPFEPLTKRHHRKDVNTFFKRAVREGWIQRNPCELVAPPKLQQQDVSVLTLDQARALFAIREPVIYRLALEAFGGLRCSSVERLRKEHVDFAARGISMPGQLHKSGKRKYRQGQPANLWAWLDAAPDETWEISERNYDHLKVQAFRDASMKERPHNVLRHTFASAHLALFKNPPLTAYLMQHTSTKTTEIYEGVMTEQDARAYFEIQP